MQDWQRTRHGGGRGGVIIPFLSLLVLCDDLCSVLENGNTVEHIINMKDWEGSCKIMVVVFGDGAF